jgi:protein-S-isoprenylcysteine O-methyltransferase Ste14
MSSFAATEFEFRHRFWFIFAIFFLAYESSRFFPGNSCVVLVGHFVPKDSPFFPVWMHALFGIAALVVLTGAALRTWGTAYLSAGVMTDRRLHSESLTADGPFRFVRNPLYVGLILMAAGLTATTDVPGGVLLVVLMALFVVRLALREEAGLAAAQGEAYDAYRRRVRRFLPSLRPRLPASGAVPLWPQAFVAEFMVWSFGVALAVLAVSLNGRLFWEVFAVGLGAGMITYTFQRRGARAAAEEKVGGADDR